MTVKKVILRITVILAACLVITVLFYNFSFPDRDIIITIPQGSNGKAIAEILAKDKIIFSKKIFLFYSNLAGSAKKFQSGTFKFNPKMSMFRIIDMLKKGKTYSIRITIPEGFLSEQIAGLLEQKQLANKDTFLKLVEKDKLEGYLFPETYFIPYGATEQQIINIMTDEFKKNYNIEFEEQAKKLKMNTHSIVILASIIEKEASAPEERGIVAGIFRNRLKKGWMLESCATVRYALKKYTDKVIYKDLDVKSPYNTYRRYGLPPGPICNPGIESIKAALYPAQTDLMFFFSNGKGTHEFSKYYKQHLERQKNGRTAKTD